MRDNPSPPTGKSVAARFARVAALACALLLAGCGLLRHRDLPSQVAGLPPSFTARDELGLAQVRKLHGTKLDVDSGALGIYGGGAVSIWVAGARDSVVAARLVRQMVGKVGEANSPFTPESTRTLASREIHELSGLGQRHFCFRAGSRVVWLAANRGVADAALDDALRFYR